MDGKKKTSSMVGSALITAIAVIFTLAGTYIPFLGILLIFLPAPFIIIGVKNGMRYSVISLIVASIMIGIFTGPLKAVLFIVTAGLSSIVIVYMVEKKYSFNLIFLFGSIASVISIIISLALMPKFIGIGFVELMEKTIDQTRQIYNNFFEMAGTDFEQKEEILSMLDVYLIIIPFLIIVSSAFTTYVNYVASGAVLRRMGLTIEKPRKFSYFKLPTNFVMGAFVIVILTYITNKFDIINSDALNFNIGLLFEVVFIMLGLAVVSFFIEKKGIKDTFRRIILVFILLTRFFNVLLFLVGVIDAIFNIRKLES
ncbi:YybS family protein [Maledivibacter halophilus]|uniref:Uncharacterized conserved protein YybS, DUF2232 family n=1 Tax=Maledivibacter halophilus TaxID=36842 RepID=A0A1T5MJB0_9FIRM|nr:DUF2232 domain-containing protein [Maledivibacter halophilus]SKC88320.1 Uncharacterized conserved protein YybS, DUF2232 family [Maledivibacter halophilus]